MSIQMSDIKNPHFYTFDGIERDGKLYTLDGSRQIFGDTGRYAKCGDFTDQEVQIILSELVANQSELASLRQIKHAINTIKQIFQQP